MKYSLAFKKSILRRILSPNSESVRAISRETGVSENSLYMWIKKAKNNSLNADGELNPSQRGPKEKMRLLLEGKSISPEEQGKWLRENGLHSEHLHQFEEELKNIVINKNEAQKKENKNLKKENQDLKKELRRKDKALAETAALLTLKKKAIAYWGDGEED
jgi:transposase